MRVISRAIGVPLMGKLIPPNESDVELGEEKFDFAVYFDWLSDSNVDGSPGTTLLAGSFPCKSNDVDGALGRARIRRGNRRKMNCWTEQIRIVMIGGEVGSLQ